MDERAALRSGESELVEFLGIGRFAEHHAAAGAAKRLVRGGGNDVGVRNRAGMNALAPATIIFGLCSWASFSISS